MKAKGPGGYTIREPNASRDKCANGHVWAEENTRWRRRPDRGGHYERDCLVCKRVSEGNRRRKRIAEQLAGRNYQ